ncbi:MAG: transglycosylase SLT domain-containing protein [Micromonosporaceae bacterium]
MGAHSSYAPRGYVPRHRRQEPSRAGRTAVLGTAGVVVVAGGAFGADLLPSHAVDGGHHDSAFDAAFHDRVDSISRGGLGRAPTTGAEAVSIAVTPESSPAPVEEPRSPSRPVASSADCADYSGNRQIGCNLLAEFGFGVDQMASLDALWTAESGWNHLAENPYTGAYGIPQALPGEKMAAFGDDWRTNPATQIRWGLNYIQERYGSPDAAWAFFQANGWY